jgi:phospholipase C
MPPKIEHLVVLMLENRSFDHMLGFLKSPSYAIDGLTGTESNPSADHGPDVRVSPDALAAGDLNPDPGHEFDDCNVQIFGTKKPPSGAKPTMEGFVRAYAASDGTSRHGTSIMKCFARDHLPVLSTLATQYAVCDRWFSSLPGPTIPNRMFTHAGTSLGRVISDPDLRQLRTIFEVMDTDPAFRHVDYRIYQHDGFTLLLSVNHLIQDQHGFRSYNQFTHDCHEGNLPAYTFIEPRYANDSRHGEFFPANDQHPDHDVVEGERLIHDVYHAIRSSRKLWHSTLLLITYDEHGGVYDHVPPPSIPPAADLPPNSEFAFDRLGVRVPAVLVSPYIAPGTIISQQFEHSSIIATVRKLFGPGAPPLGRDASAATFDLAGIKTLDKPRTDNVDFRIRRAAAAGAASEASAANTRASDLATLMVRQMHSTLRRLDMPSPIEPHRVVTDQQASDFMRTAAQMIRDGGTTAPA